MEKAPDWQSRIEKYRAEMMAAYSRKTLKEEPGSEAASTPSATPNSDALKLAAVPPAEAESAPQVKEAPIAPPPPPTGVSAAQVREELYECPPVPSLLRGTRPPDRDVSAPFAAASQPETDVQRGTPPASAGKNTPYPRRKEPAPKPPPKPVPQPPPQPVPQPPPQPEPSPEEPSEVETVEETPPASAVSCEGPALLQVRVTAARRSISVPCARVLVCRMDGSRVVMRQCTMTDCSGVTPILSLPDCCPHCSCVVKVSADGFCRTRYSDVELTGGTTTVLDVDLIPLPSCERRDLELMFDEAQAEESPATT